MSVRKRHEIWIEQCDTAQSIKLRYGLKAAFDYVVEFASAAYQHPEFRKRAARVCYSREVPVHATEMRVQIARIEQQRLEEDACSEEGDDDFLHESLVGAVERARQFTTIKALLTVTELGTS